MSVQRSAGLTPIIRRAVVGDTEAFGELVTLFQDMAVGYAYAILGDRMMAEDTAQEAFIAAWQLLSQLREPEAFPGWLRRIIFKYCDRMQRKKQLSFVALENIEHDSHHAQILSDEYSIQSSDPVAHTEKAELRVALLSAIGQLPEKEREAILLFYFAEQQQASIARFLNLPESTVKSRLFSARKKIKHRILPLMEEFIQESVTTLRPSRDANFRHRVLQMIRPTDQELTHGGGTQGCEGALIWDMMCAAVAGDTKAIRSLLERDPKLAYAEFWYTPPLHYAVREGHLEAVKLLVSAGADPTYVRYGGEDLKIVARDRNHHNVAEFIAQAQRERLGNTMEDHEIHQAVADGDAERVRQLLRDQPNLVNQPDSKGRNPLHLAANASHLDIAELLIDSGADLEAKTGANDTYLPPNFTPLDIAVWNNDWWIWPKKDWAMADLLLQHGANYHISIAAAKGDTARLEELLAQNPEQVNAALACGRRPLSAAVQFGHLDLAKRLLEAGADPNLPEGRYVQAGCALYFAARDRHYHMVNLLLERGARPDGSIDSCGYVYHVADETIRIQLYRYGLKPFEVDVQNVDSLAIWAEKDPEGLARAGCGSVFTMIVKNEWSEQQQQKFPDEKKEAILRMLLAMGVKVPPVVTGCRNYLWNKPKLTRILLESGMDPNLPNWQLVTPLHDLCSVGPKGNPDPNRLELAKMFLEFGADINARDEEYFSTPLGWAARNGLQDMVDFLLEQGAAVQLPDDEPWATPLAWATKRSHIQICDLLKQYGATQ